MNGEIPSVPITTLAGITSLTDLLPELPLPTPLPHTVNNKSLLFHPKVADDAHKILASRDDKLVPQLLSALRQTSTDHIILKDTLGSDHIEGDVPELLRAILSQDPNVFSGHTDKQLYAGHNSMTRSPYYQQQPSPYPAGQVSPYTPESPARYAGQQVSSLPNNQGSIGNGIPTSSAVGSGNFQSQFQNFATSSGPTINGGLQTGNSPSSHSTIPSPVHPPVQKSRPIHQKPSAVSSPAQASATPPAAEPSHKEQAGNFHTDHNEACSSKSSDKGSVHKRSTSKNAELRVVLEPLDNERYFSSSSSSSKRQTSANLFEKVPSPKVNRTEVCWKTPTVKLTRIDSVEAERQKLKGRHHNSMSDRRSGSKRRRISSDDEDDYRPGSRRDGSWNEYGEYTPSLSEKGKRRRRQIDSDDDIEMLEDGPYTPEAPRSSKKKKDKRRHRPQPQSSMTVEELMDTPTFKRFSKAVDSVLEGAEDVDFSLLEAEEDEGPSGPSEAVVAKSLLSELCGEAAKLKSMGVMNQVPYEKLVKLLTVLQWSVRDGSKVLINLGQDDAHEEELWRELTMDRVMCSLDASLTVLDVMTSPSMPKEVYIEDVIERVVSLVKYQLNNTVYPEFDPVYRVDPNNKDGFVGNLKMKRARASQVKHKSTIAVYNKLTELVGTLADLIVVQELTDTVILQVSSLAVTPFFVENVSELQLNALKLVTSIFSRYEKHRQLIIEDIFASLARLPSSKRNLRSFRLNSDESIQMMTALVLQLVQCVVKLPQPEEPDPQAELEAKDSTSKEPKRRPKDKMDQDVVIVTSYETSMRSAHNFLSVFLRKCAMKGEEDIRPLFEHFVYDLLSTVNKPEWPASELMLSILGRLLVQQFSNKSVDMSLRVASLDYLGIVAARLRKDAISSLLKSETIDEIIQQINEDSDSGSTSGRKTPTNSESADKTQQLQKAMLEYLAFNSQNDPALVFARQFYVAQWYRDSTVEAEKIYKAKKENKKKRKKKRRSGDDSDDEDSESEEEEREDEDDASKEIVQLAEARKAFLLGQSGASFGLFSKYKPSPSKLEYDDACLVARFLASNRPFSQSFDVYLTQILKVLWETTVAVRTKAMKCLSAVVEADPGILARADMQKGVHGRFLDQSTSVREAAVELVGKFILIRPELTTQYYDMLSDRILDTGISVRKRVIKIFRDICIEQPEFVKIPEMCVRMIRRVNDEEGIKKLVNETFQSMWFTPVRDKDSAKLLRRVVNITDVVAACKETGYDWFEQLLANLLKKEETAGSRPVEKACTQIVDCLVDNVLSLEEKTAEAAEKGTGNARLVACLSTLYLFAKIKPDLLVSHATTVQPYLNIRCQTQADFMVLHYVARILELAVPLMEHPSESFLAQLEEDMMKLVLKHGMMVLQSCISCLGAVVNSVTKNYKLVRDCFQKFFGVLSKLMSEHKANPQSQQLTSSKPLLLRSLFTVGLMSKEFDFDSQIMGERKVSVKDRVFGVMMYFINQEDEEIRHKALSGIGFLCIRHYDYMLGKELRDLYHYFLTDKEASIRLRCQVLKNLQNYLLEEEIKMIKADAEWRQHAREEDLKEMGDVQSGMASTIMQVYLKQVLEAFFHTQTQVRMAALTVIDLVLRQGLVHPVQCVPYLIAMSTDCDTAIRVKADGQIQEIDKKYGGFVQMKAMAGLRMSYRLQELIQHDPTEPVRGIRNDENPQSLNNFLYTSIRNNRAHRRALLSSMLNLFDDTAKSPLSEVIYAADNLAFFPYTTQEEPLYLIHQIDILVSVSGSNLLQSMRECIQGVKKEPVNGVDGESSSKPVLYPNPNAEQNGEISYAKVIDDDDDDDIEVLLEKLPEDCSPLQEFLSVAQGCILLLLLKQHLKDMYGFTDGKIHRYTPTESTKAYEKPVNRKQNIKFHPKQALDKLKMGTPPSNLDKEGRIELLEEYLNFRELMLSIDPADDDDDDDIIAQKPAQKTPAETGTAATTTGDGTEVIEVKDGETPADGEAHKGSGDAVMQSPKVEVRLSQLTHTPSIKRHSSSHHHKSSSSDRKHSRHSSNSSKKHTPKPHKKKKKKKKHWSDEDEDDDEDSDPDFTL